MSISPYLENLEERIKNLFAENKFNEAYKLYKNFKDKFPEDKNIDKLGKTLENTIKRENERIVEKKLKVLKPLIKEKKYKDVLLEIKQILLKIPDQEKLIKVYKKVQRLYKEQIEEKEIEYEKDKSKELFEALKKSENELKEKLFELEKTHPGNKTVLKITKKFRNVLIEKKINEQKGLLKSDKYTVIEKFIKELEKIDKKNEKIKELKNKINLRRYGTQISEKMEAVYKGIEEFDTLFKLKKYDQAARLGIELVEADKNNKTLIKKIKKNQKKLIEQNSKLSSKLLITNQKKLKEDYKKNKEEYIKI